MSVKVRTAPAMRLPRVRYGIKRRKYHRPAALNISASLRVSFSSTVSRSCNRFGSSNFGAKCVSGAGVRRHETKELPARRREPLDAMLHIEKNRRHFGSGQQVVLIVGEVLQFLVLMLKLVVDGVQFLVVGLQLLLRGLQLLVCRL